MSAVPHNHKDHKAWSPVISGCIASHQRVYRGVVIGENLAEDAEEREPKDDVRELGPLSCAT